MITSSIDHPRAGDDLVLKFREALEVGDYSPEQVEDIVARLAEVLVTTRPQVHAALEREPIISYLESSTDPARRVLAQITHLDPSSEILESPFGERSAWLRRESLAKMIRNPEFEEVGDEQSDPHT